MDLLWIRHGEPERIEPGTGVRADPALTEHPTLSQLAAVREGRIVALYDEAVLRPGPRIAEGLATLARALHPTAEVP